MGRLWVWIPPDVCFFPSSTLLSLLTLCYCNVECPKSSPSRSSCSTKDIEFVKLKFNLCCFGYLGVKWEERMPTRDSNHLWKPTVADQRLAMTINVEPNCRFKSTADAWSIRSMLSRPEQRQPWTQSYPAGWTQIRSRKIIIVPIRGCKLVKFELAPLRVVDILWLTLWCHYFI